MGESRDTLVFLVDSFGAKRERERERVCVCVGIDVVFSDFDFKRRKEHT
jgi:hypothetical protein